MSVFEEIRDALVELDVDKSNALVAKAIEDGESAADILDKGLIAGIDIIGQKFRDFEIFLPDVIMAAKAFKQGFDALGPKLREGGYEPRGRVVIGSVKGDIHDIGKNIVLAMLQGSGYEVHDAGTDVTPEKFVELVRDIKPDIVGMSALLTTTMKVMRDTVEALRAAGLREQVKIIVGGAPVSPEFTREIGADGYGEDASEAVETVRRLLAS